ncbi:unnamed protein product, partial [Rotaria sp. Silwood2]
MTGSRASENNKHDPAKLR